MTPTQLRAQMLKQLAANAEERHKARAVDPVPQRPRTPAQLASDKRRSDSRRASVEARYRKAREELQKGRDEINAERIAEGKAPLDFDAIAKSLNRK